jgi:pimeloyl-ACP methyl ester carboxylesterase
MNSEFVSLTLSTRTVNIEYRRISIEKRESPLVVFLHEGLGSLAMWRDFPELVCDNGNFRGLVFSRAGYGQSSENPTREKYEVDYLQREARAALPALLEALEMGNAKPILFGHSDGASIALIYASYFPEKVSAVLALAPHYFVEEKAITGIIETGKIYRSSEMKAKLGRYHNNPDLVFWRWHDAWISPPFRDWNIEKLLAGIRCPILAIQGYDDEYASMEQIDGIKCQAPQTELLKLEKCRHSPHKDQPQIVMSATIDFIKRNIK